MATVEELQSEIETLRVELRQLRDQVAPQQAPESTAALSRRTLLRLAPVAAVGGAIAAMSASPAVAATGAPLLLGKPNHADATTELDSALTLDGPLTVNGGMWADAITLTGITLNSGGGGAVTIQHMAGGTSLEVFGGFSEEPRSGQAVVASAAGNVAVTAGAVDAPERFSTATNYGTGLEATAAAGSAIVASTSSATATHDAVTIDYAGTSRAFYAQSHNPTNINGTVTGVNEGHGIGVWGEQRNNTGTGFGLVGVGGALGRGARLSGGAATLQMLPSSAATHPTTGKAGDFFVDASVRLWFCTKASSGSVAAVWKQLA